jgi:C4-dicarboxylate-specific signal transduction histidine kinase
MLITAYYNLGRTGDYVESVELRNLERIAESTAGRIAQLLGDSRNLADFLGTDEDFVSFMERPTPTGTQDVLRKLNSLVKANPDIQFTMLMDTSGTAIVATDPNVMGKNFKFREYFKEAMEGRRHMTGVIVGAVAGAAGVFYSRPVFDPTGVASVTLPCTGATAVRDGATTSRPSRRSSG